MSLGGNSGPNTTLGYTGARNETVKQSSSQDVGFPHDAGRISPIIPSISACRIRLIQNNELFPISSLLTSGAATEEKLYKLLLS